MTSITLTHSDGTTWTSGSRGKPPKWVAIHPDYIAHKAQKALEVNSSDTIIKSLEVPSGIRVWRWRGEEGATPFTGCFVVAPDRINAIKELNKTFKFPVTSRELDTMWVEIDASSVFTSEVGVYHRKGEEWIRRQ